MQVGVRLPHTGPQASPDFIRDWCELADEAGFGSIWGVDHVVMPHHTDSRYILPRQPATLQDGAVSALLSPNFELMTTLAYVAAVTKRIRIGTAVAVLTIRNAVLNARQLATVDRYSGGRVLYGVGIGWLEEEADAMNMPWDHRGARADEHIELLRTIWTAPGPHVEFHGKYWDIPPMDPEPRPVQQPIPILIGGHTQAAIDRAARLGDGWIAAGMSPERLAEHLAVLHRAMERHDRRPESMTVYVSSTSSNPTADDLVKYADLGVHDVKVGIESLDELKRFADDVLPKLEGTTP